MKLHEWITLTGTKQQALAKAIGMPYQRLSACVRGESIPHHDEVVKIYWITLGAVRPEDWYEIGAVPKKLQRILQPPTPSTVNVNGIVGKDLLSIIERIERIEEERAGLGDDIATIMAEAKGKG